MAKPRRPYRSGKTTANIARRVKKKKAASAKPAKKSRTRRKILGKYRLHDKIAAGGFADVYEAEDTIEGTRVAVKIPREDALDDEGTRLLLQEIRLLATLRHPNIVPLKDACYIDDRLVITMPLARTSLEARQRRRMAPERVMKYARQLCVGLAYAHERNVIHCDIKPQNLLLTDEDDLRIADFGIAKIARSTRTIDGSGAGTLGYQAPEQPHGKLSARSDVFSAGLVIYELLSKQRPEWPFSWPPRGHTKVRDEFSPLVLKWLRRALAMDPRRRYEDAGEMVDAMPVWPPALGAFSQPQQRPVQRAPRSYLGKDLAAPERFLLPEGEAVVFTHRAPHKRAGKSEDAVCVLKGKGAALLVVADGAGGYAHGEKAAATVIRAFERSASDARPPSADGLLEVLSDAHSRVKRIGRRAGTTCTAITVSKNRFRAFYAGDSVARTYSSRGHETFRLMPHSPLGDAERSGLVELDEKTRVAERHVVSTLVGHEDLRVEVSMWLALDPEATLVVASDGLWDNFEAGRVGRFLTNASLYDCGVALAEELQKRAAGETGVSDDMTFVLFRRRD